MISHCALLSSLPDWSAHTSGLCDVLRVPRLALSCRLTLARGSAHRCRTDAPPGSGGAFTDKRKHEVQGQIKPGCRRGCLSGESRCARLVVVKQNKADKKRQHFRGDSVFLPQLEYTRRQTQRAHTPCQFNSPQLKPVISPRRQIAAEPIETPSPCFVRDQRTVSCAYSM